MADLGSKTALKASIDFKIFTNTNFEVSAEDIRSSFEDTIDTLGGTLIDVGSYGDLTNLVSNNLLEAGTFYSFPYETVSLVAGSSPAIVNTAIPGYTPITETLVLLAKDTNSFFGEARSMNHPNDVIYYDYNATTETTTSTARPGIITYREDTVNNVKGHFDIRNNWVVRGTPDFSGLAFTGTPLRNNLISNVNGEGDDIVRVCHTTAASNSVGFFTDRIASEAELTNLLPTSFVISVQSITIGSTEYVQSISGTCKNVDIQTVDNGVYDVYIVDSNSVTIGSNVTTVTVSQSSGVEIGDRSQFVVIRLGINNIIGSDNNQVLLNQCRDFYMKDRNGFISSYSSFDIDMGANNQVVVISESQREKYGSANIQFISWKSFDSELRNSTGNITMGAGSRNRIFDFCQNIICLGGSSNTFYEQCQIINVNNVNVADASVDYLTYTPIERCTFHKGCVNLVFAIVGDNYYVRESVFGQGCQNLLFGDVLDSVSIAPYTQNKIINIPMYFTQTIGVSNVATTVNNLSDIVTTSLRGSFVNNGSGVTRIYDRFPKGSAESLVAVQEGTAYYNYLMPDKTLDLDQIKFEVASVVAAGDVEVALYSAGGSKIATDDVSVSTTGIKSADFSGTSVSVGVGYWIGISAKNSADITVLAENTSTGSLVSKEETVSSPFTMPNNFGSTSDSTKSIWFQMIDEFQNGDGDIGFSAIKQNSFDMENAAQSIYNRVVTWHPHTGEMMYIPFMF